MLFSYVIVDTNGEEKNLCGELVQNKHDKKTTNEKRYEKREYSFHSLREILRTNNEFSVLMSGGKAAKQTKI